LKLAYFVNQYPKVSHSFIRREILALEALGLPVERFALRGWNDPTLIDDEDIRERARTRFVLQDGAVALLARALAWLLPRPMRFASGLKAALALSRGSDRSLGLHLVSLAEAAVLTRWLEQAGVTHVHAHFGTNSAEVVHLARALGGPPYSFTLHGSFEWDMPRQLKLREKIRDAVFVAGVSSFTRAQLMRWSRPEDWPKLHQIHCGLAPSYFQTPVPSVPDTPRLVCIGRLCKEKAQILLVDAVARLVARGRAVELVLAGDGEDRPAIEARIRERGVGGQVRITGWISGDQVRQELADSRALVVASFMEALPVVIMEAMALRRPVIATQVGAIAELVRDGQEGWTIPAGSVDALVDAMERCLTAEIDALRAMGERGHARALQRHRSDDQAERLAKLFRSSHR
jgi:colanic acid/amylovoran biosynthesis glycosyltransferase